MLWEFLRTRIHPKRNNMQQLDDKKIQKLEKALTLILDTPNADEISAAFEALFEVIKKHSGVVHGNIDEIRKALRDHTADSYLKNVELKQFILQKFEALKEKLDSIEIKPGLNGLDGKDADEEKILQRLLKAIPQPAPIELPLEDIENIRVSVDELKKVVEEQKTKNPVVGGSRKGISLYVDGTKKGLTPELNIKAGTGTTLAYTTVNGLPTLTITSSGGFTELTATGTVNSVNTTFTFTQQPTYIISDGVMYKVNKGWTWSGTTATLTIPPNDNIWGIA